VDLTDPDFALNWPAELFIIEVTEIDRIEDPDWQRRIELLLEEAFAGPTPREEFNRAAEPRYPGETGQKEAILSELVTVAPSLPMAAAPRPYYSQRHAARPEAVLPADAVRRSFVRIVAHLSESGYLAKAFPEGCVDDNSLVPVNESDYIEERLGIAGLWPFDSSQESWDDDTFYSLIEVIHDAVARPRRRTWHSWNECGWHYAEFAVSPARALYRWRINHLLERSIVPLRLAESGEDIGRMVAVTDAGRSDLIDRLLEIEEPSVAGRIEHAIALFRSRGATEHDKRSAIITLAGILEERRSLLETELFRRDEGALFQIANQFAIRHQSEFQRADYDPVFLDWVFWWYAATIELTNRIIFRDT
jgi:hypothetical protein